MAATAPIKYIQKGVAQVHWTFITGVTGVSNSVDVANLPDKTVHVYASTWGTGNVVLEGSNVTFTPAATDGILFETLADPNGNALTFAANRIEQVLENPRWIRARASEVTTGATINVRMICRGAYH